MRLFLSFNPRQRSYSIILIFALLISCKKDKKDPEPTPGPSTSAEYIKGEVNSQTFYYTDKPPGDTAANWYMSYLNEGQIWIYRSDKETEDGMWLNLKTYQYIDSLILPYSFPKYQTDLDPTWRDFSRKDTIGRSEYKMKDTSFKLTIISKDNDVLAGKFSGTLTNNSGQKAIFSNGEFRIKIARTKVK